MEKTKKSRKRLIIDIVCYTLLGICFLFALIGVLLKFSGNRFNLFGYRFDVVLTDSMSSKNPKWEDFLKGHDNQIQAFDLVVSKDVTSPKELAVYDIVLFENKQVGLDMHRIVGMTPYGDDEITVEKGVISNLDGRDGILLPYIESDFVSNAISIKEITFVTYSQSNYEGSHFNFNVQSVELIPEITTENVNGGFLKTYHVVRDSTSPGQLVISHKFEYNYATELVSSCLIKNKADDIIINKDTVAVDGENLVGHFNQTYKYEIRGDKAPNSDGLFTIDKIYSKVVGVMPKMGYVVRFLSSIWGSVLLIGLGIMAVGFDIISSVIDKKALAAEAAKEKETASSVTEEEGKKDE